MIDSLSGLQYRVVQAAADKQAFDILVLDLRERSDLTDYFVICSGNSRMQVQAIADSILDRGARVSLYAVLRRGLYFRELDRFGLD